LSNFHFLVHFHFFSKFFYKGLLRRQHVLHRCIICSIFVGSFFPSPWYSSLKEDPVMSNPSLLIPKCYALVVV
jgi:hypothetical protein